MTEKHIIIEDIDPMVLFGIKNANLQIVRSLYPKLRIVARNNVIRVLGDEEQMCAFEESLERMRLHVLKFNSLREENILNIVRGSYQEEELADGVVVYTLS